jgi:hypothetical protein
LALEPYFGKDVEIPPFDPNMGHLNHSESYGIVSRTKLNVIIQLILFGSSRVETNQLKNSSSAIKRQGYMPLFSFDMHRNNMDIGIRSLDATNSCV